MNLFDKFSDKIIFLIKQETHGQVILLLSQRGKRKS